MRGLNWSYYAAETSEPLRRSGPWERGQIELSFVWHPGVSTAPDDDAAVDDAADDDAADDDAAVDDAAVDDAV